MMHSKREATSPLPGSGKYRRAAKKTKKGKPKAGSSLDEVLLKDISRLELIASNTACDGELVQFAESEIKISMLSSSGDGMGLFKDYACVVPFTLPGDVVLAAPYFINHDEKIAMCDLREIRKESSNRQNELIRCQYFGKCSGCQLQMLDYGAQLIHKQDVVRNAFHDFCNIEKSLLPAVGPTIGSPIQYNYRTKITPHFDLPRKGMRPGEFPHIGFNEKGRRRVLDIEECPIATEALNRGLTSERARVRANLASFKRGATLLLRQHSTKLATEDIKTSFVTDSKKVITEYIGEVKLQSPAGAFFQNNNAIMPLLTKYVTDLLKSSGCANDERFLVDAYCGSGLFSVTSGRSFSAVNGVEISQDSITWARANAAANGLTNAEFLAGSAEEIFKVGTMQVPA